MLPAIRPSIPNSLAYEFAPTTEWPALRARAERGEALLGRYAAAATSAAATGTDEDARRRFEQDQQDRVWLRTDTARAIAPTWETLSEGWRAAYRVDAAYPPPTCPHRLPWGICLACARER